MLKDVDLSVALSKEDFRKATRNVEVRLGALQRRLLDRGIPLVVVFEGWNAAGKGELIGELIRTLDPRGFNVHCMDRPTRDEKLRPLLWPFWTRLPARGRIAVFDHGWADRVVSGRAEGRIGRRAASQAYEDIRAFERQQADGGAVVLKFFLHLSRAEQKKRYARLKENPNTAWRVTDADEDQNRRYKKFRRWFDAMLEETGTADVPWTVIEAHDRRWAVARMFEVVIRELERRLGRERRRARPAKLPRAARGSLLDAADPKATLAEADYRVRLGACQERLRELEYRMYRERVPVVLVYEGWDAAGKGGNIRRLTARLDPRGYEVVPIGAPNDAERAHHYLWRFWTQIPKDGHLAIFDRSWYGRVLVERVEGFCREDEWRRAFREINEFEAHLAHSGAVLLKFWLQVSREEQLRRFRERERVAYKRWKITPEDWRNRRKWGDYEAAVRDMLRYTHTPDAPWLVVESDCKRHARIRVQERVIAAVEERLKR